MRYSGSNRVVDGAITGVINGVTLGAASPLLTVAGARRRLAPSEEDLQIGLLELLVGPVIKGQPRQLGGGMTMRHPELFLTYAIPNGGGRSKKTAGRMKAQGVLASMPDLCLPVMRGPFLSLYVEFKVPGRYGTKEQRRMAELLRAQGHCVIECRGVEDGLATFLGYLALPKNRPSARAVCGPGVEPGVSLEDRIDRWRVRATALLTPNNPQRSTNR